MLYDLLAFLLVALGALGLAGAWGARGKSPFATRLILLGVALRIVGSTVRYEILFRFYNGLGDAVRYFEEGMTLAREIRGFGLSPLTLSYWVPQLGDWWGTRFIIRLSGLALSALGPTMRGEFLVFALLSFLGLYAIAKAYATSQPDPIAQRRFVTWLWIWPSLWFWPSSIGKEAVLMLAVGLVTLGYVGTGQAVRWVPFVSGIGLAFAIRPHVAAVLAMAAMAAQWLGGWGRGGPRKIFEAAIAVALVLAAVYGMRAQFGLQDADLEGVVEFVEYRAGQTLQGGSNIGAVPLGPLGVPIAFVNVWMRPFPWDVHNMTSAFAALELLVFWGLVWYRRRAVRLAFRHWRRHRMLRFALPLLLVYTLMIGLAFGNLGIIARQRAPMFPFMLLFLTIAPDPAALAQAPRRTAEPARRAAA